MHEKGYGVTQNYYEAARVYRRGANAGNGRAQYNLGYLYERGFGVGKSRSDALYWFRKSAAKGDSYGKKGVTRLSNLSGSGTSRRQTGSISLSARDAVRRADNYYFGRNGYSKNYLRAMKYYKHAANKGYALGQANVGWKYRKGYGVTQNFSQALYWYRKASRGGNPTASNNIGVMYERGLGVTKSRSEAIFWYRKAATKGHAKAKKNLRRLGY